MSRPTPFVGASGRLLEGFLRAVGIDREACFVGNVCQVQPPANEIKRFKWAGDEIQGGLRQLDADLLAYQPHMVLCLGNIPLRALRGEQRVGVGDWRGSLWRAVVIAPGVKCMATYHPAAVLREMDLAAVVRFDMKRLAEELRTDELVLPERLIEVDLGLDALLERLASVREGAVTVSVDIEGVVGWIECIGFATSPWRAFVVPFIHVDGSSVWTEDEEVQLWEAIQAVLEDPLVPKILQNSLYDSFVLAWTLGIVIRGLRDDTMLKHFELYCELEKSLGFQASIYTREPFYKSERKTQDDRTHLTYCGKDCCVTYECNEAIDRQLKPGQRKHYEFNLSLLPALLFMELRGIRYDYEKAKAKLKHIQRHIHVLQDLLNRAGGREACLAFYSAWSVYILDESQGRSMVGREGEAMGQDQETVSSVQAGAEKAAALIQLIASRLCLAKPRRRVNITYWQPMRWNGKRWVKGGKRVSFAEGAFLAPPKPEDPEQDAIYHKEGPTRSVSEPVAITSLADCREFARVSERDTVRRVSALVGRGHNTAAVRGELSELLGCHVKVESTGADGDACWFLYNSCKFEKQFQKDGNRLTDRLASDDEALIKIWVAEEKRPQAFDGPVRLKNRGRLALAFLKLRRLLTQTKTLRVAPDADGRMRCAYNLVGTETGRLTCYKSPTGSGYNLQTVTKPHRDLFLADDGHLFGQRDLSGADGWTVAAYAAAQGDRTMLDDYLSGMKPAKIVARIYTEGAQVTRLDRAALKDQCRHVDGDGWLYFACKRVQHGSSYLMGKLTMSNQILTDSWKLTGKPVFVEPATCERIQKQAFFVRYWGIPRWHAWMEQELKAHGCLLASNGFKRLFFGRKDEHSTVKQALAHLPQVYTTYATMLALSKLWTDPDNRLPDGSLREEPLHTVHDSLLTQFRVDDLEWSRSKGAQWFDNPMLIAREMVTIPYEGACGRDWKNLDAGTI